jgi:phage tail P2-like protein
MNRLLPPNSTTLEHALAGSADEARLAPEIIATLWDAAACPAANLPWLAWSLSVDQWDDVWDEATQRRVIATSIKIHRQKGTVGAVEEALTMLGHTGKISEWWQQHPPGVPHTFLADVDVDNRGIDLTTQQAIERQIVAVKPARSHMTLRLVGTTHCGIFIGSTVFSGEETTVYPYLISEIQALPGLRMGVGMHVWSTVHIYPASATISDYP